MADQSHFQSHVMERRFQLLVDAVTDYAIYMLEPDGTDRQLEPGRPPLQGL